MPTLYKTNGDKVAIKRRRAFSVAELQEYVGGYFELIPIGDNYLVVNDEGFLMNLPLNENASKITAQLGWLPVVGDALFTEKRFIK